MTTSSKRRSFVLALGAGMVAMVFGRRTRERALDEKFVEHTPPGTRYRTFAVGGRPLYLREDVVQEGRFRDFRAHGRGEGGR